MSIGVTKLQWTAVDARGRNVTNTLPLAILRELTFPSILIPTTILIYSARHLFIVHILFV
jgi:hypothetical protein